MSLFSASRLVNLDVAEYDTSISQVFLGDLLKVQVSRRKARKMSARRLKKFHKQNTIPAGVLRDMLQATAVCTASIARSHFAGLGQIPF